MKTALVLIDLQRDFLESTALQPAADELVSHAARLLELARKQQTPVIHVWTTVRRDHDRRLPHWRETDRWACEAGTPGQQPPECLRPRVGEPIVHKHGFNAFHDDRFERILTAWQIESLILTGLHLHACVRAVATEALERNVGVGIAEDAVATNDPLHGAAVRRWLAARCVRFAPGAQLLGTAAPGSSLPLTHYSPRLTAEKLFEIPITGKPAVALAAARAREASRTWRAVLPDDRIECVTRFTKILEGQTSLLARQLAQEVGKPVAQAHEELQRTVANLLDVVARARSFSHETRESTGVVRRRPLGVVALITPWNNPVAIPLGKIAPALAFGNTVVWKPAPAGTAIAEVMLRLLQEAGLPTGAVALVTGDHTTAQALAEAEDIHAVTFTGSLAAGHEIQEICARRFLPLQAELSGNNAAIVWDDADLAVAAEQVAWGAFGFAGQRCTANRRVIVPRPQLKRFLQQLQAATRALAWGDPLDEGTVIGPVLNTGKRDAHEQRVERAMADPRVSDLFRPFDQSSGAKWIKEGACARPAMAVCEDPAHPLVQEETMSPLLVVQPADDFEHALALCNGVRQGLVAALFSRAPALRMKFLDEAAAGILKFDSATAGVDVRLPFGGCKASSLGPPEHGEADAQFYTRLQAVYGRD